MYEYNPNNSTPQRKAWNKVKEKAKHTYITFTSIRDRCHQCHPDPYLKHK